MRATKQSPPHGKWRRRVALLCALLCGLTLLISAFFSLRLESQLQKTGAHDLRVWAHRGLPAPAASQGATPHRRRNTIEAFDRALKAGFTGIELDVTWDPGQGLLVGHPGEISAHSPSLSLTQVFARYGATFSYWIDFKALRTRDAPLISAALHAALSMAGSEPLHLYVESRNMRALKALQRSVPRIVPVAHMGPGARWRLSPMYALFLWELRQFDVGAVSLHHDSFSPWLNRGLAPLEILLYTVNQPQSYLRVASLGADVVITDTPEVLAAHRKRTKPSP